MRIFRHLISWVIALGLIAMFVQDTFYPLPDPPDGWVKFFDAPGQNVVFQTIAERSGVTLFEPAGRFFVGVVEILAAIFLLFPRSRRFGAFLSALVTGAAPGARGRSRATTTATARSGSARDLQRARGRGHRSPSGVCCQRRRRVDAAPPVSMVSRSKEEERSCSSIPCTW